MRAALRTTRDLRDAGYAFVVAPVLTLEGEPLSTIDGGYAVALYPFVEGERFDFGAFSTDAHRLAVLDLIIELAAPGQHDRDRGWLVSRRLGHGAGRAEGARPL